jgi:hypothetical protein
MNIEKNSNTNPRTYLLLFLVSKKFYSERSQTGGRAKEGLGVSGVELQHREGKGLIN